MNKAPLHDSCTVLRKNIFCKIRRKGFLREPWEPWREFCWRRRACFRRGSSVVSAGTSCWRTSGCRSPGVVDRTSRCVEPEGRNPWCETACPWSSRTRTPSGVPESVPRTLEKQPSWRQASGRKASIVNILFVFKCVRNFISKVCTHKLEKNSVPLSFHWSAFQLNKGAYTATNHNGHKPWRPQGIPRRPQQWKREKLTAYF